MTMPSTIAIRIQAAGGSCFLLMASPSPMRQEMNVARSRSPRAERAARLAARALGAAGGLTDRLRQRSIPQAIIAELGPDHKGAMQRGSNAAPLPVISPSLHATVRRRMRRAPAKAQHGDPKCRVAFGPGLTFSPTMHARMA